VAAVVALSYWWVVGWMVDVVVVSGSGSSPVTSVARWWVVGWMADVVAVSGGCGGG
jgi:hypothetical protein